MEINIVMGLPFSGKSHFIKEKFSNAKIIDLFDYQKDIVLFNVDNVLKSYEDAKDELINSILKEQNVVLEHPLLKAARRQYYIEEIRKVTSCPINIYCTYPNIEVLCKRANLRGVNLKEEDAKQLFEILELPKKSEGFSEIYII